MVTCDRGRTSTGLKDVRLAILEAMASRQTTCPALYEPACWRLRQEMAAWVLHFLGLGSQDLGDIARLLESNISGCKAVNCSSLQRSRLP